MDAGRPGSQQVTTRRGHRDAIRQIGEALSGRYTEIGLEIATRALDEIPGYDHAAPELINDLRAGATATVELFARTLRNGAAVRREDLGFLRELAARRVHQGVSLEDFIRAYRVALLTIWDACVEDSARLGISPEVAFTLARSTIDTIDILTTQAAEAYLREETRIRTQSGQAARDLVERLIHGEPTGHGRRHPAAPGLDPTGTLLTIVGSVAQATRPIGEALQLARDTLEDTVSLGTSRPLAAIRHGELIAVVPGTSPQATITRLRAARQRTIDEHDVDVRYGISIPSQGFASVEQAYREASLSLSYASASHPIVSLDHLSALECAMIAIPASTRAIIASKGNALRELPEAEFDMAAQTIRAFAAANLNVTNAAEALRVHANTIRYRLQRVATKTGHDPRTFTGLVELICILESANDEKPCSPRRPTSIAPRAAAASAADGRSQEAGPRTDAARRLGQPQ
jgi:hypothetical protein